MPLKCLLYRWVLRFDKNTVLDAEFRRSDGRTFQAAGPAAVNDISLRAQAMLVSSTPHHSVNITINILLYTSLRLLISCIWVSRSYIISSFFQKSNIVLLADRSRIKSGGLFHIFTTSHRGCEKQSASDMGASYHLNPWIFAAFCLKMGKRLPDILLENDVIQ